MEPPTPPTPPKPSPLPPSPASTSSPPPNAPAQATLALEPVRSFESNNAEIRNLVLPQYHHFKGFQFHCKKMYNQMTLPVIYTEHHLELGSGYEPHPLVPGSFISVPDSYRFTPTFIGALPGGAGWPPGYPFLTADISSEGRLSARALHSLSENLKFSGMTQMDREGQMNHYEASFEYGARDWCGTLKAVNVNPVFETGDIKLSYNQRVANSLVLGGNWNLHYEPADPRKGQPMMPPLMAGAEFGAVWSGSDWRFCGSGGVNQRWEQGVELAFTKDLSEAFKAGVEYKATIQPEAPGPMDGASPQPMGFKILSAAGIGFMSVFQSDPGPMSQPTLVRGQVNADGKLYASIETSVKGPMMRMALSGMIDLWNHTSSFGIKFDFTTETPPDDPELVMKRMEELQRQQQQQV